MYLRKKNFCNIRIKKYNSCRYLKIKDSKWNRFQLSVLICFVLGCAKPHQQCSNSKILILILVGVCQALPRVQGATLRRIQAIVANLLQKN